MSPFPEQMSDHWWWRPGVRPGRRLLVWHILFHDHADIQALVAECQNRLGGVAGIDAVPAEWLHMTTQIIGFEDEISSGEMQDMTAAAAKRLQLLGPVRVEVGKPLFHSEAVVLGIRPPQALDPVRAGIREAIAETVAAHQLDDEPEWTPHISVAYSNSEGPAAPVMAALRPRPAPRSATIREVHLVSQVRDGHLYRWEQVTAVPLGG
jgi:2'-5' RNA ligase